MGEPIVRRGATRRKKKQLCEFGVRLNNEGDREEGRSRREESRARDPKEVMDFIRPR